MRRIMHTTAAHAAARTARAAGVLLVALALGLPGSGAAESLGGAALAAARPVTQELAASPARSTVRLERPRNHEDVVRELDMERGKSVLLQPEYAVKRVSVGDPDLLDVVVLNPREIQLVAKQVGGTNVVLYDPRGRPQAAIEVSVGAAYSHVQSELRRILADEDIRVDSAGESVVLQGRVSSPVAMEQALRVVHAFFPDKGDERVINLLEIGGDQQVMIKVVIAEMSRSLRRRMGTNFAASFSTGGQSVDILTTLGDVAQNANLVGTLLGVGSGNYQVLLDVLSEKRLAKVLAEPTLVARSGESASFLAGGEVPIPVAQGGASFGSITVEFKKFGVGVGFTPTVLGPDRIHLQVSPEVSEPDFTLGTSVAGTNVPGFNTRRVSTGVELADGQTFAIAGLLRDDVRELASQYPVLGDIPILGALFRSSQYQKDETELVLLVTPHIVKPLGAGPHPLPTDNFIEPDDFEFYLLGRLEGRHARERDASFDQVQAPGDGGLIGAAGHRIVAWPEGRE